MVHLRFTIFGMESLIFLTSKLSVFQKSFNLNNKPLFVSLISGFSNENIDFINNDLSSKVSIMFSFKLFKSFIIVLD
jgi:hypothetical protein